MKKTHISSLNHRKKDESSASLNHRKKMKAEPNRLIPRKLIENLELLFTDWGAQQQTSTRDRNTGLTKSDNQAFGIKLF